MNFERVFDRKKDNSIKWNKYADGVLPLWVADMDFEVAQPIQLALENFIKTGIYGYAAPSEALAEVIIQRFKEKYKWEVKREWIVWNPSVVSGLYISARVPSTQGYSVMTSTPVYRPFLDAAEAEGRTLQAVPLKQVNNSWVMDFDAMEMMYTPDTKLYILCNPHNPTGRIYSREELEQLADFCNSRGILVCSDEIHADIIMDDTKMHIPYASLSQEAAMNSINLFSPGKAYNMPGINSGFAIIPNKEIRERFINLKDHIVPNMTKLGGDVAMAAYADSNDWLSATLAYLNNNHEYLYKEINAIPGLKMNKAEATYLAWIDYSELGVSNFTQILEDNGVGVIDCVVFMGENHFRLNFGTQKNALDEAVKRIKKAVEQVKGA